MPSDGLRVAAYVPDLLFGSKLLGALSAAGYDVALCGDRGRLRTEARGAAVVIVDLTADAAARVADVVALRDEGVLGGARTLGFYSHVDAEARELAAEADIDRAVPRSRIARDAPALVAALASG